jgi:hypothetical protein
VAAITERFSDAGDILDNFISGRDFNVNLCNPAGQAELEDLVEAHRPEVLFMDPWQQLIVGYDENLAKDVGPALKFLDGLIAQYELTIFLDVHTGKDKRYLFTNLKAAQIQPLEDFAGQMPTLGLS